MIVKWKAKEHYKVVASWYHARNLPAPLPEELPELGFIVDSKVAGWVARTDSCVALIDTYISNPHSTPGSRKAAMEKLTGVLLDTATSLGYTKIVCLATPRLAKMGEKFGLIETDQRVVIAEEADPVDEDLDEWS